MSEYHKFSNYVKVSDLKKLDFIVSTVNEEAVRIGKPLSILEVGCGTGNIARPLASLGHELLATDINIESLQSKCRNPALPTLKVFVMDACSPLSIETFQVVVCSEVLEHLEFPNTAIDAIKKCYFRVVY
jgi:2-polyprenyl-3-methyl-5-hydroxy-6-metoxy-1,4-benzoquinol methylase